MKPIPAFPEIQLLGTVVTAAVHTVAGLSAASVTLVDRADGRLETASATSEVVRRLDDIQYSNDSGPCVDAAHTAHVVTAVLPDNRWPDFSKSAVEAGVRSVWSVPLITEAIAAGVLNLYFQERRPWDGPGASQVRLFADQAGAALAVSAELVTFRELNGNLYQALESRTVIGQAQGILMARQSIDSKQAFDVLRRASQRTNRKLRDIAADIVAGVGQPEAEP